MSVEADKGPGDGRSIENPTEPQGLPDELDEAVRSDADNAPPVQGEETDDVGSEGEKVSEAGEGLVTGYKVLEDACTVEIEEGASGLDVPIDECREVA